jgi:stalled ribosome rescue protein Dom34
MDFAREVAEAIEASVIHESATRIILAGDEVAIPLLHKALPPKLEPLVSEQVLRLDIRSPRADVQDEIAPLLAQIEADESHDVATRLIEAVREQGLGVIGVQETHDALNHGQAETLALAEEATLPAQERNELVHLAAVSGANVETIKGHEALTEAGGVGALLRYRVSWT